MADKSSTCELNYCRYLPFFNIFDAEFNAVIGNWTNTGKFTFVYAASELWETVPTNLKRLSINNFKKRYKNHLKCQS